MLTFCVILVAVFGAGLIGAGVWYMATNPVTNLLTGAGWFLMEAGAALIRAAFEAAGASR